MGCGSSAPSLRRNPASQLINIREQFFLVDCGEGTQLQMRRFRIKFQRIHHIFISHLHGDHYLGLIGLVQSMHLLGRKQALHIYAHPHLEEIVKMHLRVSQTFLNYELIFHPLSYDEPRLIFENRQVSVSTVILRHRIPCCGFVFREKEKPYPILPDKISEYQIPVSALSRIKQGEDYRTPGGTLIPFTELTGPRPRSYAYAYCSDTIYHESIIPAISGVDWLFHESTFTEELRERAKETYHSTARQAAEIAYKAGVGNLLLGHFSVRYKTTDGFLEEARAVFPRTFLADDGKVIAVEPLSDSATE